MWHNLGMRTMSIRQLRDSLSSIEEITDREGEVILTRHGRPLARLVSLNAGRRVPSHADLRVGMPYLPVPSELLIRADRDATAG